MQEQAVDSTENDKEKDAASRFEELVAQYESPVKALVHEFLEKSIHQEFENFIGPRLGQAVPRDSDGKIVRDYRNGYRTVKQVMVDTMPLRDFRVPRNRAGGFRSKLLENTKRRAGKLAKLALEMFVHGVSNRRVRRAFEKSAIPAVGLSKSSVSRITKDLMAEYLRWSNRRIEHKFMYLQADAVYVTISRKTPRKAGTLMIIGIREDGYKEVLHFTVGAESERNFDEALGGLIRRGLDAKAVALITLDGAAGPLKSTALIFGADKIQRCTVHKTRNVLEKTPRALRDELKAKLGRLWNQPSRADADRFLDGLYGEYGETASAALNSLREDADELLNFYGFPDSHRKTIRSTNLIERVIREARRRTKVMEKIDTEHGCYGVLMGVIREQNERWSRKSHWRNR